MARTKQTARYSCIPTIPKSQKKIGGQQKIGARRVKATKSTIDIQQQDQKINTNQFSVNFDNQTQCEKSSIKQKYFICQRCSAYLNNKSMIQKENTQIKVKGKKVNDAKKVEYEAMAGNIWNCQFCGFSNIIPADVEVPKQDNPCYFVQKIKKQKQNNNEDNQNLIIYCIDISGSMDLIFSGKSRLSAVKQAIKDQIKRMKFQGQKVNIGIVVFGSIVLVKKSGKDIQIQQQSYYNFDKILEQAAKIKQFTCPVNKKHEQLNKIVQSLTTYGSTALGPGLLTSIQLAGRQRGSKIILCTDGQANQGLYGQQFYNKAAKLAKQKGVMVSILSLKGDCCNLKQLSKLSLQTGGAVLKIDPKLLGTQFNKISKQKILGTGASLKIVVSHIFQIQEQQQNLLSQNKTSFVRQLGNFSSQTQLTFNFKILSKEQGLKKKIQMNLFDKKVAPMQVQLSYINPNGQKYIQIINDFRILSQNEQDQLKQMNFKLYSSSSLQKVSKYIKNKQYEQAETLISNYYNNIQSIFRQKQNKKVVQSFLEKMKEIQKVLKSKISKENNKHIIKTANKAKAAKLTKKKGKSILKKQKVNVNKSKRSVLSPQPIQEEEIQQKMNEQIMQSDEEQEIIVKFARARDEE